MEVSFVVSLIHSLTTELQHCTDGLLLYGTKVIQGQVPLLKRDWSYRTTAL